MCCFNSCLHFHSPLLKSSLLLSPVSYRVHSSWTKGVVQIFSILSIIAGKLKKKPLLPRCLSNICGQWWSYDKRISKVPEWKETYMHRQYFARYWHDIGHWAWYCLDVELTTKLESVSCLLSQKYRARSVGILHEGAPCKQLHVTAGLNCNNRTGPSAKNWSKVKTI